MVSIDQKMFASEVCKTLSRCVRQVFTRLDAKFNFEGSMQKRIHSQPNHHKQSFERSVTVIILA